MNGGDAAHPEELGLTGKGDLGWVSETWRRKTKCVLEEEREHAKGKENPRESLKGKVRVVLLQRQTKTSQAHSHDVKKPR